VDPSSLHKADPLRERAFDFGLQQSGAIVKDTAAEEPHHLGRNQRCSSIAAQSRSAQGACLRLQSAAVGCHLRGHRRRTIWAATRVVPSSLHKADPIGERAFNFGLQQSGAIVKDTAAEEPHHLGRNQRCSSIAAQSRSAQGACL
jgi:hypothetical protein